MTDAVQESEGDERATGAQVSSSVRPAHPAARWAAWGLRISLIVFLGVVYAEERRWGALQSAPLEEGETWHDRKWAFYRAIDDRFDASLIVLLVLPFLAAFALGLGQRVGGGLDVALIVFCLWFAFDAFMRKALGFT